MKHRDRSLYTNYTPIPDRKDISERPKEADDTRFSNWKMDLIVGPENKGAIENYNKLLRQYIPKSTDLRSVSEQQLKVFQYKINNRPREKLSFDTPKNAFFRHF